MLSRYATTKYWLERQFTDHKWTTLQHNGVMFPEEYKPHNTPIIYNGRKIVLNPLAEEYATLFAKYINTEYLNSKTFQRNFWSDWKQLLNNPEITSLKECDFSLIHNYILNAPKIKKDDSKIEYYTYAYVDGVKQKVGNFRIEPPGIFLGRGENPKLGKLKKRIYPEDIIINIGEGEKIPEPLPGHEWKAIIHNHEVEWLASWIDDVTGSNKYVWLSSQSDLKSKSDIIKFDKARVLKKKIKHIREENFKNMTSSDIKMQQTATALYLIDKLALRVGGEKGEDDTDTVGVTSLRVEHIKFFEKNEILLDFLGKDSVRYTNRIIVEDIVYQNLVSFSQDKNSDDQLFDKINSNDINKYLQTFMTDLTAKVFRTYNASYLFQKELDKINKKYEKYDKDDKQNILLNEFNLANAKVAMLCNHQKNISKGFHQQLDKVKKQISLLKQKYKTITNDNKKAKIKDKIKKLKMKLELKSKMKNISLNTSKVNYIDPRITASFLKKHGIAINKIFTKALQEKFKWAFEVDETFHF